MVRTVLAIAMILAPVFAGAAELIPIRSNFDDGYDIKPYRIGIVIARQKAAVFEYNEHKNPGPLINTAYGRHVPVDPHLRAALNASMANTLQNPYDAQFRNVQMMTDASETLVVACGTVQDNTDGPLAQPFVALFTNPHANDDVQSIGFSASAWISDACLAMGFD